MMKKINVGIIGTGRIADAHMEACLYLENKINLLAVANRHMEKAKAAAEKYDIKLVYNDHRELLNNKDIDAVIICLPNSLHKVAGIEAANAGKHILMEKPLAVSYQDGVAMVQAAEKNKVNLMAAQCRRYCDAAKILHDRKKDLGEIIRYIINFSIYFQTPPTPWWNSTEEAKSLIISLQGSHSLDTLVWMAGETPVSLYALTQSRGANFSGMDEADIIAKFKNGATGTVHLSFNTKPSINEFIIVGEKTSAILSEYSTGKPFGFGYILKIDGRTVFEGEQNPNNFVVQLNEFIDSIIAGRKPLTDGREVLTGIKTMDTAIRSAESGKVELLESVEIPSLLIN